MAKRDDLDMWFEDECHFQQHGSRCTMWIPPEITDPLVLHAPTRKNVGVFGAVSITDGRFLSRLEKTFSAQTFLDFLKQLMRRRRKNKKLVVVLDNARWHHAQSLAPWLYKHKDSLFLCFLPPYSPELNSIERVWKLTRRLCTHNRYFPTLENLTAAIANQFDRWSKPNNTLRQLCAII